MTKNYIEKYRYIQSWIITDNKIISYSLPLKTETDIKVEYYDYINSIHPPYMGNHINILI